MHEIAKEEIKTLTTQLEQNEAQLFILLLPKDPNDESNIFIEIRAGTGGDEAGIFVGDLFRMYQRYAESKRWQISVISSHVSAQGGFKEIIAQIQGQAVFASLKFEAGVHRVQRIPTTESQGRIHTSACTVAVLPELKAIEEITINPSEIRIDTYRSSGAGGQHVNTTDSAVRITHLPTGIVAECQDERSQHKNKAKAMRLLSTKILDQQQRAQQKAHSEKRKDMVGSGDRSERIRTYNFPQSRITDHRINQTWYQLDDMMEGHIEPIITALKQAHQAEQLTALKST